MPDPQNGPVQLSWVQTCLGREFTCRLRCLRCFVWFRAMEGRAPVAQRVALHSGQPPSAVPLVGACQKRHGPESPRGVGAVLGLPAPKPLEQFPPNSVPFWVRHFLSALSQSPVPPTGARTLSLVEGGECCAHTPACSGVELIPGGRGICDFATIPYPLVPVEPETQNL